MYLSSRAMGGLLIVRFGGTVLRIRGRFLEVGSSVISKRKSVRRAGDVDGGPGEIADFGGGCRTQTRQRGLEHAFERE
jgi:hypothetical protein